MQVPPPSADGRRRGRGGRGPGVVDGELRAAQLQVDVEGVDGDVADRRPPRRSAPPGAASGTAAGCRPRQLVSPTALFLFFVSLSISLVVYRGLGNESHPSRISRRSAEFLHEPSHSRRTVAAVPKGNTPSHASAQTRNGIFSISTSKPMSRDFIY